MSRFPDWSGAPEVKEIVEQMVERFPGMFEGFDPDGIDYYSVERKSSEKVIKLHARTFPDIIGHVGHPYIVEINPGLWNDLERKRKNLCVFHVMCAIPEGGFDEDSQEYAKKRKPEIEMFMLEYAACGGVPNWMENPSAKDPLERNSDDIASDTPRVREEAIPAEVSKPSDGLDLDNRIPVTVDTIASVGDKSASAA